MEGLGRRNRGRASERERDSEREIDREREKERERREGERESEKAGEGGRESGGLQLTGPSCMRPAPCVAAAAGRRRPPSVPCSLSYRFHRRLVDSINIPVLDRQRLFVRCHTRSSHKRTLPLSFPQSSVAMASLPFAP
jgi:hypothetical protein